MKQHRALTEKQKKLLSGGAIAIFILLGAALAWFVGRPMVRFAKEPEVFRQWVAGHGFWGMAAYTGMVFLQVLVAIIPGEPLEIGAGYAFGAVEGTILCLIGAVLGGAIVVLLVRRYGVKLVEVFFPREKIMSLRFMQDSRRLELVGCDQDAGSVLGTVGLRGPVDYTVVQGRVTVRQGHLVTVDEELVAREANNKCRDYLANV